MHGRCPGLTPDEALHAAQRRYDAYVGDRHARAQMQLLEVRERAQGLHPCTRTHRGRQRPIPHNLLINLDTMFVLKEQTFRRFRTLVS